jgi:hypothetical protein
MSEEAAKRYARGQHGPRESAERSFGAHREKVFVWLVNIWLILAGIGVIITFLPEAPRTFLVPSTSWETKGGFFANCTPAEYQLPRSYVLEKENIFWRSWSPETHASIGTIHSKPFFTKASAISLPLVGYPNAPGNDLYLENASSGERLTLRYGNAHEVWQELIISIPTSWRSKPLIVGAESRTGVAYVGLGPPAEVSWATVAKRSLPVCLAWHLGTCAFLILLAAPCQSLMVGIVRGGRPGESWRWLLFPLALALIGYLTFFGLYFFPLLTWILLCFCVISGVFIYKREIIKLVQSPAKFLARRSTITLWVLLSGIALILLYAQTPVSLAFAANYRFSPASWSTDNQLPVLIGDFLTQNNHLASAKLGALGPWQVSDRPPVLAGLMAPFLLLSHLLSFGPETSQLGPRWTQIVGTCVLTTWIFPVWVILRKAGLAGRQRVWAIALLTMSPFFFFNMVYTWPKLLSATLGLLGWFLVAGWKPGNRLIPSGLLAGACFSMSLMSHGSAFFGLLAFGTVFMLRFPASHGRLLVLTGAASLLLTSPWLLWVRYCDPPGNALVKAAFAGLKDYKNKEGGVGEIIWKAYSHDSFKAWAERKLQGIQTWLGIYQPLQGHLRWELGGNELRRLQFFNLIPALGLWLIPLILVPRAKKGQVRKARNVNFEAAMFVSLGLIGLTIQLVLMWDTHVIHTYAYSTIACLHLAAVISLAKAPIRWQGILSKSIFGWFVAVWILSPIYDWGHCDLIQTAFILLALAVFGGLIWEVPPRLDPVESGQ